ncbi:hypothetical protein GW17_00023406, partial [Ensete ventricosum]
ACSSCLVEPTQGILINGQFPGPQIEAVTNDNLIVNVFNSLPEPFLISWLLLSAISKAYRFRVSNVGVATSLNIRIQGHALLLVEVEGSHTLQNTYSSLDIHLGQSYSFLVTADQPPMDYYIVVSTRFTTTVLSTTAILHYSNSDGKRVEPPPGGPTTDIEWSLNQARSISGPRPNPQGSYHYGYVNVTRTIRLANSAPVIDGKQRYAVNSLSFIPADTPLKLADFYNISGVFELGSISDIPTSGPGSLRTSVMAADFRAYVEIVFENSEPSNGWRAMDTGKQGELQPKRCSIPLHCSGVSQLMVCYLHAFGQRGHVEHPIGKLGSPVLGSAVLYPRLLSGELVEGRESNPEERPSLRPGVRPSNEATLVKHKHKQLH